MSDFGRAGWDVLNVAYSHFAMPRLKVLPGSMRCEFSSAIVTPAHLPVLHMSLYRGINHRRLEDGSLCSSLPRRWDQVRSLAICRQRLILIFIARRAGRVEVCFSNMHGRQIMISIA